MLDKHWRSRDCSRRLIKGGDVFRGQQTVVDAHIIDSAQPRVTRVIHIIVVADDPVLRSRFRPFGDSICLNWSAIYKDLIAAGDPAVDDRVMGPNVHGRIGIDRRGMKTDSST